MRHQRAPLPLGLVSAQHWTDGGKEERKDRVLGGRVSFPLTPTLCGRSRQAAVRSFCQVVVSPWQGRLSFPFRPRDARLPLMPSASLPRPAAQASGVWS